MLGMLRSRYKIAQKLPPGWPWAIMLFIFVLFGGGGPHVPITSMLLQIVAIIAITIMMGQTLLRGKPMSIPWPLLALILSTFAVFAIELTPLPPTWWTHLPARAASAQTLVLVDGRLPWWPVSLDPWQTWATAFTLLPALAALMATVRLSPAQRTTTIKALILAAGISGFFALLQVGGIHSAYVFDLKNMDGGAGVFANPNHQVDLMLAGLLLTAWIVRIEKGTIPLSAKRGRKSLPPLHVGWIAIIYFTLMTFLTGSRAGAVLAIPASILAVCIATRQEKLQRFILPLLLILVPIMLFIFYHGNGSMIPAQEGIGIGNELRLRALPDLWTAINTYMPVGSGLGTFDTVFRRAESLSLVKPTYFNHAHNDYLEILIETGAIGIVVVAVAIVGILGRAAWVSFRAPVGRNTSLCLLGANFLTMVCIHSIVDYPLRTIAISTVFAVCLAVLFLPIATGARDGSR